MGILECCSSNYNLHPIIEEDALNREDYYSYINENFISIEISKEERPDLANLYITLYEILASEKASQLCVFMDYNQVPIFIGSYEDDISSFYPLLKNIKEIWDNTKNSINKSYSEVINLLKTTKETFNDNLEVSKKAIKDGFLLSSQVFDPYYGGFESLPKYPSPHNLMFLLKFGITENMINPTEMVEKTLISIFKGGIYDHIAGGFLRYSTDEKWLVPYFEKTLYTNALLVISYLDIYQITNNNLYKRIIEDTLNYIKNEMTTTSHSFYSSQNLGLSNKKGEFYIFDYYEIINLLGDEDGSYFNDYFGVTRDGNFNKKNILNLIDNYNYSKIDLQIDTLKKSVYTYRKNKQDLLVNTDTITFINSLVSLSYSKAYRILNNIEYLNISIKNINFIKTNLINNNRILRSNTNENSSNLGYLDDYAYFIWALIDIYESTYDVNYLEEAINYTNDMINLFWDFDNNGFFFSGKDSDPLILNLKYIKDEEIPSGNSVAAFILVKLSQLTKTSYFKEFCENQFNAFYSIVSSAPVDYTFYLSALIQNLYPSKDIICITNTDDIPEELRLFSKDNFIPNLNTILITPSNKDKLLALAPYLKDFKLLNDTTTYYVFENNKLLKSSNTLSTKL